MTINWDLVSRYLAPILTLGIGTIVTRKVEKQPKVVSYLVNAAAVALEFPNAVVPDQDGAATTLAQLPTNQVYINTHSIIVKNTGKKTANNVKVCHHSLQFFSVYPPSQYTVVDLPQSGKEIVFPRLVPNEQIVITYVYMPPLTVANINAGIKSDEGLGNVINVQLSPVLNRWAYVSLWIVLFTGATTLTYGLLQLVIFLAGLSASH